MDFLWFTIGLLIFFVFIVALVIVVGAIIILSLIIKGVKEKLSVTNDTL